MKRWIRWQGLGVFFGVIVLFCVFWFLFIDGLVKSMIEKYGSQAVGAKVELASADISLFPAGLELRGLQVTNPDEPMKNALEVARIHMNFDTLNLFRRKVIVEQMEMMGIKLNTPRKTSGALPGAAAKWRAKRAAPMAKKRKSICKGGGLPSISMPDVNGILSKEKLRSVELATSVKVQIQKEKEKWQERLASLPDQKTFESYRTQIQQIKSGGGGLGALLSSGGKALELKKKIEADVDRIKSAKKGFQKELGALKQKVTEAKKAPFKDAARLARKYGLSEEGLANLSSLIFGVKICGWMEKAANWYEKMRPILERAKQKKGNRIVVKPVRGKGVYVKFKERHPLPDFLIKQANASVLTGSGAIQGIIKNITPDQDVLGKPLTFSFKGDKLKNFKLIESSGVLNHIKPQAPKDQIKFLIKGFQAKGITLLENSKTPLLLEKALADLNTKAVLQGENIKADIVGAFHSATFSIKGSAGENPIMNAIFSALNSVTDFIVNAKVKGTLEDYDIQLSSDLDGILKKSVGKILAKQTQQLRQELSQAIMAKVNGPLSDAEGGLSGLGEIDKELSKRLKLGSGLLGYLGRPGGIRGFKFPFS